MSAPTLLRRVNEAGPQNVVVTGGEPLEHPAFVLLVAGLHTLGHRIEVKTAGTLIPPAVSVDQWNVSLKLSPEEAATTFMGAHRKRLADGLFLTSGVPGRPTRATDRMLATLEILRRREGFAGYVHIKLLARGRERAGRGPARWANRISVNLEAPIDAHVRILAPPPNSSWAPPASATRRFWAWSPGSSVAGSFTTRTSARSNPSPGRRWKDARRHRQYES